MENQMLSFPAPAKINHFLHITGQLPNGYHRIQTLFQFVELCDQLQFQLRQDSQINVILESNEPIAKENNLVFKAAKLLQSMSSTKQGIDIYLNKVIPIGAGLGGGSSNAATTLMVLNYLWQLQLSMDTLANIALQLGADVPVFILGHSAFAEGIGDILYPVEFEESWLLLVCPPCQVLTSKMFSSSELTRNTPAFKIEDLMQDGIVSIVERCGNDFEPLVRKIYPEVDNAIKWLSNFGKVRLSGSGASIFVCLNSYQEAEQALKQLPLSYKAFVVKSQNQSALMQALNIFSQNNLHPREICAKYATA